MESAWYKIANESEVPSPALLLYPDRIRQNLRRMLELAGSPERLRPHVKTCKLPEIIRYQLDLGMTRFKCATIAEAEMIAETGCHDVLLAYQPVGPNIPRWIRLVRRYPDTRFSTIVDDAGTARALSAAAVAVNRELAVCLDVDCGMHRTGIAPGQEAIELYRFVASLEGLSPVGLHVYDGHVHDADPEARIQACNAAWRPVLELHDHLREIGFGPLRMVAGGTPTFPIHAKHRDRECSPGTCVLWDAGYGRRFPDLPFLPAAMVLTRVVSRPTPNRLCLDLGHKAIAAENPHPRVVFEGLSHPNFVGHSEEHLVLESDRGASISVGDVLYGVPWHICPTVALYREATVVENGRACGAWTIKARDRRLSI